jgi:indole-3-glycerol phosphate synthase
LEALRPGFAVIAEIKRASPAAGPISNDLDAAALARRYVAGGARAVSVWTDARYFNGDAAMVAQIRRAVPVPVLRKDFILDPYQVYESRAIGADAVLLIAALLQAPLLRGLIGLCSELGMAAAVDAHRAVDVDSAVEAGAQAIFIHNRDVGTFEVDIGKTLRFRRRIPKGILVVSESGIGTPADIARVCGHVDAVLVGTALMQSPDPEATVRLLLSTANSA